MSRKTATPLKHTDAWLEHNLSQLRYFRSLSLREKMLAVEGMADIVRRLDEARASKRVTQQRKGQRD